MDWRSWWDRWGIHCNGKYYARAVGDTRWVDFYDYNKEYDEYMTYLYFRYCVH